MKRSAGSRARLKSIRDAIQLIDRRLREKEIRASVGDLVRLIKAETDISPKRPRKVIVQWVESPYEPENQYDDEMDREPPTQLVA